MSERIHVLAQQLFGRPSVEECDLQDIRDLVRRYPYFAPAQFLLLEKLKKEDPVAYQTQLQKSVLYYHNPLEFSFFISPGRFETEVEPTLMPPAEAVETAQENSYWPAVPEEQENLQVEQEKTPEPEEISPVVEEMDTETGFAGDPALEEKMAESIERVLVQEEQQITEPGGGEPAGDLLFEPFHTVDYFASQGIRLSQEEVSKDKFGRQLKSFTEWLKTMKRLPSTELSKNIDAQSESTVQHLAEDSVHRADVVTEAMAEVWVKQGNRDKAIETYNKLGLLNPSKKAYFAGLIENLKRS